MVERPAVAGPVPTLVEGGRGSRGSLSRHGDASGLADRIVRASILGLFLLGVTGLHSPASAASPAAGSTSTTAASQAGESLKWTQPRQARSSGASRDPVTAKASVREPRPLAAGRPAAEPRDGLARAAATATQAAQQLRDTQARRDSRVVRASHEEVVAAEPSEFPQTLVPPANAQPLIPSHASSDDSPADSPTGFPARRADLAMESDEAGDEPRVVVEEPLALDESDSTLREMMDAVAETANTTELQMASRLQPIGDADLERPLDLPGEAEPATDAMLQDVFGAEGEASGAAADEVPPAPRSNGDAAESLPLEAASPGGFAEQPAESLPSTPSEGPPPGEEEGMLDPGDFVPQGSQSGDAEPPADRQPGDEVVDFNGRDCARERHMLQSAWYEMRQTPLHSISLDITPSLEPTGSAEEAEKARIENMGRVPARVWHDKDGQVMARGKMVDFKNSRVIVQDESGQLKQLSWYQLGNDELCFVSSWWELPTDVTAENSKFAGRNWTPTTMTWVASALCHKPLYFEDVQLERYGHSAKPVRQAALSGVHFFGSIFLLPYHMGMNPPTECQYALGYYRPGSCAPWLVPAFPWSGRGARMQAGALSGAILWYP